MAWYIDSKNVKKTLQKKPTQNMKRSESREKNQNFPGSIAASRADLKI
ncbi:TPA: hypothetical protein ACS508_002392 [Salmonella enterica]